MVAVGDDGKPVEVPPFVPVTEEERRRHEAAIRRRQIRQESPA